MKERSLIMRSRSLVAVVSLFLALPLLAGPTKIYSSYETVRQALLKNAVPEVQKSAAALAAVARSEKQQAIASRAEAVGAATDLASARQAFALLSDEVIRSRAAGDATSVVYCPMEKKSWLQPAPSPISNPYVDAGMRSCGQLVKDNHAPVRR